MSRVEVGQNAPEGRLYHQHRAARSLPLIPSRSFALLSCLAAQLLKPATAIPLESLINRLA